MSKSAKQEIAKKRQAAKTAWTILNNKTAFDALTAVQKAELLRQAMVFALKNILKDEIPD